MSGPWSGEPAWRSPVGDLPKCLRNALLKWDPEAKPEAAAISAIVMAEPTSSRRAACSRTV